jgi:hypothetical protein
MSLPSFEASDEVVFKEEKPSRVIRKAQGSVPKEFKCAFPGCKDSFDRKNSLTNHMKTHEKPLKEIYAGDLVQIKLPSSTPVWDSKNEWYIKGVKFPDGYKLHKIVALDSNIVHPVSGHHISAMTVILVKEDKKDD